MSKATLAPVPGPGKTETQPEANSMLAPYQSAQTAFSTAKAVPAAIPATGTFLASPLPKNLGSTFFRTFLTASLMAFFIFFLNFFSRTSATLSETGSMTALTYLAISSSLKPEAVATTLQNFSLCFSIIPLVQLLIMLPGLPPFETASNPHSAESRPILAIPLAALKPASVQLPATFAPWLTAFLASLPATTPTTSPTPFPAVSTAFPATLATPLPTALAALLTALKGFHIFCLFLNYRIVFTLSIQSSKLTESKYQAQDLQTDK